MCLFCIKRVVIQRQQKTNRKRKLTAEASCLILHSGDGVGALPHRNQGHYSCVLLVQGERSLFQDACLSRTDSCS